MSPSLPQLHWRMSPTTGCYHAVAALLRGQNLADADLTAALAGPAERLAVTLAEDRMTAESFFGHLIPLAATLDSPRRQIEVALTKLVGQGETAWRLPRFEVLLADARQAFARAAPEPDRSTQAAALALRRRWDCSGPGLLTGIANRTEQEVFVPEATVATVYPALGGGGSAYPSCNLVCIEAAAADLVPELPEPLRLAWLLAQLNLKLPAYSETLPRERLAVIAGLALVPVVLAAAEPLEQAVCDEPTIRRAVTLWMPPASGAEAWPDVVVAWWDVYRTMRPRWLAALQALDQMLACATI